MDSKTQDSRIRDALQEVDAKGKLCVLAAVSGFSEKKLREIMISQEELAYTDRHALTVLLGD